VDEDHLTLKIGLLNTRIDDVLLYRILDIKMTQSLGQKIFGVGSNNCFYSGQIPGPDPAQK